MSRDKIHPLKMEDSASGGTELDPYPTGLNPNEDFVDARGVTFQNSTSDDEAVTAERDADDNLVLTDPVAGSWKLSELTGGALTAEQHKALRQLIHFIEYGPGDGFGSSAYNEVLGGVFATSDIWWESDAKLKKISEKLITWSGAFPTQIVWKIYDTDGGTVLATATDVITYPGSVFEPKTTRTIVVS